jgi:hypothetical protein
MMVIYFDFYEIKLINIFDFLYCIIDVFKK